MTARKTGESWDEFWAEVSGGRTEIIRGVEVRVPSDVPIGFEERVSELSTSSAREDIAELVGALFGDQTFEAWEQADMGLIELMTVLTWGMAQASGQDVTFREAYEMVTEAEAAGGKAPAPNRAARRAAPKQPSAAGGGRSKATSSGSTGSARRTSRA